MTVAGLFWSLSLTGNYRVLPQHFLSGGVQDPRFRDMLSLFLFIFFVLNSLIVAASALRMARPKILPTAG